MIGGTILCAIAACHGSGAAGAAPGATHTGRVPVRVAAARREAWTRWINAAGSVRALNTAVIHARVDDLVERVAFRDGQSVARGALLFALDPKPFEAQLAAARAQRARDAAQLQNARRDFARFDALLKSHATSAQTRDTALAAMHGLEATVAYDEAQVRLARLNLSYTRIEAPFAGRIGARLVDPGNLVHSTDAGGLAELTQVQPIYVEFAVPQDQRSAIEAALRAGPVTVEARPGAGGAVLGRGRLVFVDNHIDPATGTLACRGEFANAHERLWPGEFVSASVRLGTIAEAVTIPAEAVQAGPEGAFLYVVGADSIARRRPVRIGETVDGRAWVRAGLVAGERVVTRGEPRLRAVTPVRIEAR